MKNILLSILLIFLFTIFGFSKVTEAGKVTIIYPKNGDTNVPVDAKLKWTNSYDPKPDRIQYTIFYKLYDSEKYLNADILYNDDKFTMILWNLQYETKYTVYMMSTIDNQTFSYSDTITFTTQKK
jgi:hypothetical protein